MTEVAAAVVAQDANANRGHRQALRICAHSRFTTEDLLAHVLGGGDGVTDLFDWPCGLSFVEYVPWGVFPHDLIRDVIDADLRLRDRAGCADLHRQVSGYLIERARNSQGAQQRQACTDILFLHRTNPRIRPFVDWSSLTLLCGLRRPG